MKRLVVVAFLAAGGCGLARLVNGPTPTAFTAPDGRTGFSLSCDADMAYCHNEARTACGGDYEVLNQRENQTYQPVDQFNKVPGIYTTRTMQVACSSPAKE